jgi:dihydroorotate dehydrogenase
MAALLWQFELRRSIPDQYDRSQKRRRSRNVGGGFSLHKITPKNPTTFLYIPPSYDTLLDGIGLRQYRDFETIESHHGMQTSFRTQSTKQKEMNTTASPTAKTVHLIDGDKSRSSSPSSKATATPIFPGIMLSNGHRLRWMAASGALKFDGKGWMHEKVLYWLLLILSFGLYRMIDTRNITVAAKTVTLNPIVGNYRWWNPFRCIRPIFKGWRCIGFVNKVGLTNMGLWKWRKDIGNKRRPNLALIASVYGSKADIIASIQEINQCPDIVAVEVNLSCPNMGKDTAKDVEHSVDILLSAQRVSTRPTLGKLAADMPYLAIARALTKAAREAGKPLIEAISFNTVPWNVINPGKRSPLHGLDKRLQREAEALGKPFSTNGGGVSGIPAQSFNWPAMQALIQCPDNDIPVIGGSMWSYDDVGRLIAMGCKAISFGSIHIAKPWAPTRWSDRWDRNHR